MKRQDLRPRNFLFSNSMVQLGVLFFIVVLNTSLNAIIDSFLHPEIPYFDGEHLLVGGITGIVSAILFGLILVYSRHLEQALSRIRILESFLPICSNCKKIRIAGADATRMESWRSIEAYISERTGTRFSHGICPECRKELYPEIGDE